MTNDRIPFTPDTRLLVLTGAGVSAASGLPTFRDANGLWEGHNVQVVASPQGFAEDPALVWRFYAERRAGAERVRPNAAHEALMRIEQDLDDRFLLATQNVDGLHHVAGSRRVVELHGSLWRSKCARCNRPPFPDRRHPVDPPLPTCDACAEDPAGPAFLRPDIVWFGEFLDSDNERRVSQFMQQADLDGAPLVFLAIGTSGVVLPAAGLVRTVKAYGGTTWLANLDTPANVAHFDHVRRGPATEIVPWLLGLT